MVRTISIAIVGTVLVINPAEAQFPRFGEEHFIKPPHLDPFRMLRPSEISMATDLAIS